MANEGLAWPNPPTGTNLDDGTQAYNMGIKFGLVTAGANCVGIRWRVPDSVVNPQGFSHNASLWSVIGEVRLANVDFDPVPGGDMDILFPSPVALSLSTEYVVAVYTNHYTFSAPTPSSGWHVYSPGGNTDAYEARLASYNAGPNIYPASNFNGWYYVAPLMEVAGSSLPEAAPSGQAIPVSLGGPTAALGLSTTPGGLTVPVAPGTPAVALNRVAIPGGLAIPVALGQPSVGPAGVSPSGLAIPVATGQPSVSLARVATPSGLAIPVATGQPSTIAPVATGSPGPAIVASSARGRLVATPSRQIIVASSRGRAATP